LQFTDQFPIIDMELKTSSTVRATWWSLACRLLCAVPMKFCNAFGNSPARSKYNALSDEARTQGHGTDRIYVQIWTLIAMLCDSETIIIEIFEISMQSESRPQILTVKHDLFRLSIKSRA
jgi:hypothetical protein